MAIGRFAAALIVVGAADIGAAVGAETIPGPAAVVRVIDGDTLDVRARVWVGNDNTALVRRRAMAHARLNGASRPGRGASSTTWWPAVRPPCARSDQASTPAGWSPTWR